MLRILAITILFSACGFNKPEAAKSGESSSNKPIVSQESVKPVYPGAAIAQLKELSSQRKNAENAALAPIIKNVPSEEIVLKDAAQPAKQETVAADDGDDASKKTPCLAGETYEKATGRCLAPVAESYECVQETQVYDWNLRRCRLRQFREWCEAQERPYEVSVTIGKLLNTLGVRECREAERELLRSKVLYVPVGGQKISNIAPIAALTHLTALYLPDNHIVDISPLTQLKNLEILSLRGNDIQDVSPLLQLPNLKQLDVTANPILDTAPLNHIRARQPVSRKTQTPATTL